MFVCDSLISPGPGPVRLRACPDRSGPSHVHIFPHTTAKKSVTSVAFDAGILVPRTGRFQILRDRLSTSPFPPSSHSPNKANQHRRRRRSNNVPAASEAQQQRPPTRTANVDLLPPCHRIKRCPVDATDSNWHRPRRRCQVESVYGQGLRVGARLGPILTMFLFIEDM